MKLSNGMIGVIASIVAFVVLAALAGGSAAGASGFQAGQQFGYAAGGPAVLIGVATWAVLKYGLKRRT
ncbi:MAG TPA: hypothetical protein VJ850_02665 [Candidatus Limnocylindrales bacterium]|nr:hypothetical protein [Candidatus Limnocylindrales bacterium]